LICSKEISKISFSFSSFIFLLNDWMNRLWWMPVIIRLNISYRMSSKNIWLVSLLIHFILNNVLIELLISFHSLLIDILFSHLFVHSFICFLFR
jgi:hypothetical protein